MTTIIEEQIDKGVWCENCHQYVGVCECDNCEICHTAPEPKENV